MNDCINYAYINNLILSKYAAVEQVSTWLHETFSLVYKVVISAIFSYNASWATHIDW